MSRVQRWLQLSRLWFEYKKVEMKHDTNQRTTVDWLFLSTSLLLAGWLTVVVVVVAGCCILLCSIFCHQIAIENKTRCKAMPATKWRSKMQHSNTNGDLINNSHIYVLFWWFRLGCDAMGLACFTYWLLCDVDDGLKDTGKRFWVIFLLLIESNWALAFKFFI